MWKGKYQSIDNTKYGKGKLKSSPFGKSFPFPFPYFALLIRVLVVFIPPHKQIWSMNQQDMKNEEVCKEILISSIWESQWNHGISMVFPLVL